MTGDRNTQLPALYRSPFTLSGLPQSAPIAVAFSGGADSVALLDMLICAGASVSAVHVHHGIRGVEADRDAAFCRAFAESRGIPFALLTVDAPKAARERGESLETAARRERYRVLEEYLVSEHIPLLATAHHADDQLETVLQHLLRGSGLRGLCGIPPVRAQGDITLVRPLLQVTREELRQYLAAKSLAYVSDSTNEEDDCERNRLRHTAIPALKALHPDAARAVARCAANLRADEECLADMAKAFVATEGTAPCVTALAALPDALFLRVMRLLLPQDPTAAHIAALRTLVMRAVPHSSLSLPPHTAVCVEDGKLLVKKRQSHAAVSYHVPLLMGENFIEETGALVVLTKIDNSSPPPPHEVYTYHTHFSLCTATIEGELYARERRAGDTILAGKHHKAVRRLGEWRPYGLDVRAKMPLICDDMGIVATPCGTRRDGTVKNADISVDIYF